MSNIRTVVRIHGGCGQNPNFIPKDFSRNSYWEVFYNRADNTFYASLGQYYGVHKGFLTLDNIILSDSSKYFDKLEKRKKGYYVYQLTQDDKNKVKSEDDFMNLMFAIISGAMLKPGFRSMRREYMLKRLL